MRHIFNPKFFKQFSDFPIVTQKKFWKQLEFLVSDLRHPSLHAKKYDEVLNIWQARVDKNVRFYFSVEGGTYFILDIKKHPK